MRNICTVCLKDWVLDQGPFMQTVSVISWIDPMDLVEVQNNHRIIRIEICKWFSLGQFGKNVSYLSLLYQTETIKQNRYTTSVQALKF